VTVGRIVGVASKLTLATAATSILEKPSVPVPATDESETPSEQQSPGRLIQYKREMAVSYK
jgi:hypothetical protein